MALFRYLVWFGLAELDLDNDNAEEAAASTSTSTEEEIGRGSMRDGSQP